MSETEVRFADRVRSPDDLRRLADFERAFYIPLLLSAILPIVTASSGSATDSWVSITVNVVAWLVFVIDLRSGPSWAPSSASSRRPVDRRATEAVGAEGTAVERPSWSSCPWPAIHPIWGMIVTPLRGIVRGSACASSGAHERMYGGHR
jgi:hypothetical protein